MSDRVTLAFTCGHRLVWQDGDTPVCPQCGCRTIARTTAPKPRFTGVGVSPLQRKD